MTLKDEIKKTIIESFRCKECDGQGWYAQQTGDHEQEQRQCWNCDGTGRIDFNIDTLAQRIADSLVVDEERVFEVVQAHMNIIDPNENYSDCTDDRNLAKDIAEAKPIKCEVD